MKRIFAFECFADRDIYAFLSEDCRLPLDGFHAFGQGEVVNQVLVRQHAHIGLVDEDPGRVHHPARDRAALVFEDQDVALRRSADRHIIVLKPELEECFLRSMGRVQLRSDLPSDADRLRAVLSLRDKKRHARFRHELVLLLQESQRRRQETMVTTLRRIVQQALS